jgi:spermidine synthase
MKNGYVYLVVTVSGASVLALEILGTRVLGPFYGVSLYLWSALITVTLAALSLGYALGGRWADAGPRIRRLSLLLLLAGLWVALIPLLRRPVLSIAEPFGLRFAVLVTAAVLFFPPLTLLGMVSPYAIRLKASSIDVVGRTAGNLYAISTVASVASALLVGFFLIPRAGVVRLTLSTGMILIGTSLIGLAGGGKGAVRVLSILLIAGAVVAACAFLPAGEMPASGVIAVQESPYGEIRVVDQYGLRYLLIDGGIHTVKSVEEGVFESSYASVLDVPKRYFEHPGSMLLIGLGGGAVAESYARDGWQVDAVEIDPAVTQIAREQFGLAPTEATVHHADGRRFLSTSEGSFDIIILDAYGSSSIPFHLVTREAFALAARRLSRDGLLVINVQSVGWDALIVRSLAATLARSFEAVLALPMAEPPNTLGNLILLAANRPLELSETREPEVPIDRMTPEYDRFHAWENRFQPDTRGVPVLTDDLNPSDVWAEATNLATRKKLHEFFEDKGEDW